MSGGLRTGLAVALGLFVGAASGWADAPPAPAPLTLPSVTVTAQKDQALNTIDRKTYAVAQDIQGSAGTATDVLSKIPSVEIDIDGNVSLRGDSSVQILIDGHSSALMGANRADFLSQYPADSIERIEVITNPTARYKPDGTGGIINIVLRKRRAPGYSGSVRFLVGNRWRGGVTAAGNYNPGKFNAYGSLTLKQDDRIRYATDRRTLVDPESGTATPTDAITAEHTRLIYQLGRAGFEWTAAPWDRIEETVDYSYRTMKRRSDESSVGDGTAYNRFRFDPEGERDVSTKTAYRHEFGRDDDTLDVDVRWEHHDEIDNDGFTDVYQVPVTPDTFDRSRLFTNEPSTELNADYADRVSPDTRVEAGLDRSEDRSSQDQQGADLDPDTGVWVVDPNSTNLFRMDQRVDALYGTLRHRWGDFGATLGVRGEAAEVDTDQVTAGLLGDQRYARLYPTLHTSYDLTANWELQLNYSSRVHRPDAQDLNPYPQVIDPNDLVAGNPGLRPEQVQSVETGVQYRDDTTTGLATLFYKCSTDGFTTVTEFVSPTTLLTTQENLASTQSGGLEFSVSSSLWKPFSFNASGDLYYNQIDATNLGYPSDRSGTAATVKGGVEYDSSKATAWQLNANQTGKRLTPQGYRLPAFVANFGVRHDFRGRRWSAVFTISDLFNSQKDEIRLDTPTTQDDFMRRRSSRIFSVGLVWTFGKPRKDKADGLEFDN